MSFEFRQALVGCGVSGLLALSCRDEIREWSVIPRLSAALALALCAFAIAGCAIRAFDEWIGRE